MKFTLTRWMVLPDKIENSKVGLVISTTGVFDFLIIQFVCLKDEK